MTADQDPNMLRWQLGPSDFEQRSKSLTAKYQQVMDQIAQTPVEARNFESVMQPLANFEAGSSTEKSMFIFPRHVFTEAESRNASAAAAGAFVKFQIETKMRLDVFQVISEYARSMREEERCRLDFEDHRFLDRVLRDYRRYGLALDDDARAKSEQLAKRISELCLRITQNLNNDDSCEWFTSEELKGLPGSTLNSLAFDEEKKLHRVLMKSSEVAAALNYVVNPEVRARIDRSFKSKQQDKNTELCEEVLRLRQEQAHLLGYENGAEFALETCMARSTETVDQFYRDLMPRLLEKGREELQVLSDLKVKMSGEGVDPSIYSHDFEFYHTRLEESLGVDQERIRQYFPFDHVVHEMLTLYENLFSFRFQETHNDDVWHQSVRYFKVFEHDDQEVGAFYLDMFTRTGKFSQAACFPLQLRCFRPPAGFQKPVGALVCNFTQPTADRPSLLKHSEVCILFHEFGHMIHGLSSKVKYARMAGTATETDFTECPSQMLENWCYIPAVLRRISKHCETGEPLPQEILDSLIALKNLNSALLNLRKAFLGQVDQLLHRSCPEPGSTQRLWHELRREVALIPEAPGTNPLANFSHIFGGYGSRFYGYLWSQVYAAALFEKFKEQGFDEHGFCRDPALGRRYRNEILAPGGSRDSLESLRIFLGHEPSVEPFLRSIGLE